MNPIRERLLIWLALLGAIATLIGGIGLARRSNDPSWINRSGAAVVCLESLVVLAEFSRRWRIRLIEESLGHTNPYIRREAIKAERRLVIVGVSMAVLGEGCTGSAI